MSQSLTERHRIAGVLSRYDRLVITGTLPGVCCADGMSRYLGANGIRIFDYLEFAKTLRGRVRDGAAALAAEAGIVIEHIGRLGHPSVLVPTRSVRLDDVDRDIDDAAIARLAFFSD